MNHLIFNDVEPLYHLILAQIVSGRPEDGIPDLWAVKERLSLYKRTSYDP